MIQVIAASETVETQLESVRSAVGAFHLLEEVVRWAFSLRRDVAEVVVQDEFTHDVVLPWVEPVYLVFDTT